MRKLRNRQKSSKSRKVSWDSALDIKRRTARLIKNLDELSYIEIDNLHFFRSQNSKARAYARIWGLPKIWQISLNTRAHYAIEVLSEKYDMLNDKTKDKVLLHELAHIPKTFSGALLPHTKKGKGNFHDKLKRMEVAYHQSNLNSRR